MKQRLPFFNYKIRNQSADTLEISIEGEIVDAETQERYKEWYNDDTSVSFKSFRNQVSNAVANGVKIINCTINSAGGQVTEALAIADFITELENQGVAVHMHGTGIVASAATYPLIACKNSSMSANSFLMIHNVSGHITGDVNEVENYARTMRKFNDTIRDFYANVTGQPKETISNWMNRETWLSASEAKDKRFIKRVTNSETFSNSIEPDKWLFNNTTILNAYNSSINSSDMNVAKITESIDNGFKNLLERLGLANKSEDANVAAAIAEFKNSLVNALKGAAPDESKVRDMVNSAMGNSLEELKTSISNQITEATKNVVSADDLKKVSDELERVKADVVNRTGSARSKGTGTQSTSRYDHAGISFDTYS